MATVMKRVLTAACVGCCLLLGGMAAADGGPSADTISSQHMVAQALLTAYFIDAARKAGMDPEEINAALARVAEQSIISEFWISDETGQIAYGNIQGADFAFPTDPDAGTQAALFAVLLGAWSTSWCRRRGRATSTPQSSSTSGSPGSTSRGSFRSASPPPS